MTPLVPVAAGHAQPPERAELPLASLTAFDRILQPAHERDRTFFIALGIVFLLHLVALIGALELGDAVPDLSQANARGQVEKSRNIEVELVEAPSEDAERKPSQVGRDVTPVPPAPQSTPSPAQPEVEEAKAAPAAQPPPPASEPAKPEAAVAADEPALAPQKPAEKAKEKPTEKTAEKPKDKPLRPEDFDTSMADYAKSVERAASARKHEQQMALAYERAQEFGAAPVGRQSAYTRATLDMLSRTKPDLFTTRGQVFVSFELDRAGKITWIKLVKSSGDLVLDTTIYDWLKRAKYDVPPPDATHDDLHYDIHFTVR
jgi:TonB family protein